ncbi:uncharacterized protein RCC_06349 [Ramularia collo-cygni]|uniref:Uncharacterized protein n=1 Tax=Ramularia collo-cygni TaxID=112498 RepID=A0A2D3VFB6_9PEZI|nr:uncharacterized protein RCC_06349 [Ramularia collo-cygni]CZT20489.1 uncharacterized protein RCC_06349 [Ramularia collo-cygni]
MVSLQPTVVEVRSARDFLQYVLDNHAPPSTLVVCSSKADFLETLQSSDDGDDPVDRAEGVEEEQSSPKDSVNERVKRFAPTLRLLSRSRTVKLAFCPDITHLRAYLACINTDTSPRGANELAFTGALHPRDAAPILAILNPIELHRPTSAFSAQGLNRTLSIAVEAAYRIGHKLVLAETARNAWLEELSLLNVTNRRLGELAVGRTVTPKAIAQHWCMFERHVPSEP